MNYIKRLETENGEMRARMEAIDTQLRFLKSELCSDKFRGYDAEGDRKDWMSTRDIDARYSQLLDLLTSEEV